MGKANNKNKVFEVEQQKLNAKIENFMDQNASPDHAQFFLTPEILKTAVKPILQSGGVLNGALGYNPSDVTISSASIDIGGDSGKYAGFVILTSETGTADTLDDIVNFKLAYQELTLQAFTGHTITITTGGNIDLVSDITLTNQIAVKLFYDIISNTWKRIT